MITAKDLYEHVTSQEHTVNLEKHVDNWLETKVFPFYSATNNKFEVNNFFRRYLECFEHSLYIRGFDVKFETERCLNGSCTVILTIPTQGE